ncbi:hypothetical protein TWF481_007210 [Arthrobotrys musiformis]|uniref:Uncharacterized protein n=1 Tax=Arthrobotrys musiformis TaxID=47236 RepID=A0AAV9WCV3_9PEZI
MFRQYVATGLRQIMALRGVLSSLASNQSVPQTNFKINRIRPLHRYPGQLASLRSYTTPNSNPQASVQPGPRDSNISKSDPSEVTATSPIRLITETSHTSNRDRSSQQNSLKGSFQHDLSIIRETFAFKEVPKEVLFFGGVGLVPYIATTVSTFFLAWDIERISQEGVGYFLDRETASTILSLLEPVQVGFGAVILSFLGAIHWGLEFAAYGGSHPYQRYLLGILAPAMAWPTVFMQYDIALLTQFLGFTGMYFADSRATTLGLAPRWYTTYRFLLTFIVGACIVMTLIGRSKIGEKSGPPHSAQEMVQRLRQAEGLKTTRAGYRKLVRQDEEEARQVQLGVEKRRKD